MNPGIPDLSTIPADLVVPAMRGAEAAAGRRVRQQLPRYQGTAIYHALYLPTDWAKGSRYPVIVEYAGNGNFRNKFDDACSGRVEESRLGYGLGGGQRFIWVCLPFVDARKKCNAITWWGDSDATAAYCIEAVDMVCRECGGDPNAVVLSGFSRGAIACNYIGLRNDAIAALWTGFIAYSHYDGVRPWPYEAADRHSAIERLKRLKNRPVFICSEESISATRDFIASSGIAVQATYCVTPFRNHSDAWVLRPSPARGQVRQWLAKCIDAEVPKGGA